MQITRFESQFESQSGFWFRCGGSEIGGTISVRFASVFVVYDDMMANRANRDGILAVVVTDLVAISSDFDFLRITRWHTHFDIDAGFAACILVAGVGNLNNRGDGTRGDVANAAVLDVFVNLDRESSDRSLGVCKLWRIHRVGAAHWLLGGCRINRIGSW